MTINALSWSAKPASPSVGSMQFRCWHVSSPFCDVIERRACETFKNYRQYYVIIYHVMLAVCLATCRGSPFCFWNPHGVGWVNFLVESQSRIYPKMCAKFGCGPTVESRKKGRVQTERQSDTAAL